MPTISLLSKLLYLNYFIRIHPYTPERMYVKLRGRRNIQNININNDDMDYHILQSGANIIVLICLSSSFGRVNLFVFECCCYRNLRMWPTLASSYCITDSRFVPSQWETALLCNDFSHCLGASLWSALFCNRYECPQCRHKHHFVLPIRFLVNETIYHKRHRLLHVAIT